MVWIGCCVCLLACLLILFLWLYWYYKVVDLFGGFGGFGWGGGCWYCLGLSVGFIRFVYVLCLCFVGALICGGFCWLRFLVFGWWVGGCVWGFVCCWDVLFLV